MRRTVFITLALSVMAVTSATPGNSTVPALATSVAYQQNVKHAGRVREDGLNPPFQVAWSVPLIAPSYPLIADGRAFVTARRPSGSYGTRLVAIDLGIGSTVWSHLLRGTYYWANAASTRDACSS